MFDEFLGLIFFTIFLLVNSIFILRLKNPRQIFLSGAIISAPWFGGLWLGFIKLDIRLTYVFLIVAFLLSFNKSYHITRKNKITFSIVIPMFCLILWSSVSSAQAYDPSLAFGGVVSLGFNFIYLFTIIKNIRKGDDFEYIIRSLFLGLFYISLLAIIQYKMRFFHIGFIDRGYKVAEQYRRGFMHFRSRSTFHHANQFGMYLILILPMVFREIIIMFQKKNIIFVRIYSFLFLVSLFALYTTSSRGSWIGFAFGMIAVIGIDLLQRRVKKTRKIMFQIGIVFCIIILAASIRYGPRVYDRIFKGNFNVSKQADKRSQLNQVAFNVIKRYPYIGVGVWNFKFYTNVIFTHNLYLLVASEVGIPGLFFFIWLLLGFFREAIKSIREKNFFVTNVGRGMLSILLGFLLASIPGPDFWISNKVSSHLWIIAGLMVGLDRLYRRSYMFQKFKKNKIRIKEINKEGIYSSEIG